MRRVRFREWGRTPQSALCATFASGDFQLVGYDPSRDQGANRQSERHLDSEAVGTRARASHRLWSTMRRVVSTGFALAFAGSAVAQHPGTSIEIDLQQQTAYLIRNGRVALSTPICPRSTGAPHREGIIQRPGTGAISLFVDHGRIEDRTQPHHSRRCRRRHAGAARLPVYAGLDALFHSLTGATGMRRNFARISRASTAAFACRRECHRVSMQSTSAHP